MCVLVQHDQTEANQKELIYLILDIMLCCCYTIRRCVHSNDFIFRSNLIYTRRVCEDARMRKSNIIAYFGFR